MVEADRTEDRALRAIQINLIFPAVKLKNSVTVSSNVTYLRETVKSLRGKLNKLSNVRISKRE